MSVEYNRELTQSYEDWMNHNHNTIVFYERDGKVIPLTVREVTKVSRKRDVTVAGLSFMGNTLRPDGAAVVVDKVPGEHISLRFPALGMSDARGRNYLTYMYYQARRQFRKSFNMGLVSNYEPHAGVAHDAMRYNNGRIGLGNGANETLVHRLYQIINSDYLPIAEAAESVLNLDKAGVALSRNFGIAATDYSEHPVIVYKNTDVGFYDGGAHIEEQYMALVEEFEQHVTKEVTIHA